MLVFGHHHAWNPDSSERPEAYFGINPDDSERLVEVVARRPRIVGYFAGHTHRNRVRRFSATGDVPWVEVACVKDFPGAWAEYRVFEGGILQVFRRISSPEALAWSEKTRDMYGGLYETTRSASSTTAASPSPRVAEPRGDRPEQSACEGGGGGTVARRRGTRRSLQPRRPRTHHGPGG